MPRNKERVEFAYEDPALMPKLLPYIAEHSNEASFVLRPNVPEFLEATYSSIGRKENERYDPTSYEFRDPHLFRTAQNLIENHNCNVNWRLKSELTTLVILDLCELHNIRPFTQLLLRRGPTKINYLGIAGNHDRDNIIGETCRDPAMLVARDKWESISFEELKGEKIAEAKSSIDIMLNNGYVLTKIRAGINPHWRGSSYYERVEYDAELDIDLKKISIYAEMDEDFKTNPSLDALMQRFLNITNPEDQ